MLRAMRVYYSLLFDVSCAAREALRVDAVAALPLRFLIASPR